MKISKNFFLISALLMASAFANEIKLINGQVVDQKDYPHIISIKSSSGGRCTATLVGPRVILTAAHCAQSNQIVTFKADKKTYKAKIIRSRYFTSRDHDLALGIIEGSVETITPAVIGGKASKDSKLQIFGYGCTRPGGSGGSDGKLRTGSATIVRYSNLDMVSRKGAALCYGDSGGPAFQKQKDGRSLLLGVNSKGNIRDTNYNARNDLQLSKDFFEKVAETYQVDICGVNSNC